MKRQSSGPILSAVFVDYDNIYLSLKRKSEEAAKRFAKDALSWVKEVETGRLITPTNGYGGDVERRIVMNRCYGNPVPRRNAGDNSTDMNSFPFVRHHFLRAGFEIIDCPPLTAQLKNSSDIRMVMDVRDFLTHDTYFDEFIILSGDADFTPVLHRLRAHARRTVIFANDYTAAPYTAISDGEVREADLIGLLLEGRLPGQKQGEGPAVITASAQNETIAQDIIAEVTTAVRGANAPLPLEALADRAMRALGHDKTIATGWAGAGSFRELLLRALPEDIRLTEQPPYLAFEVRRALRGEPAVEPQPQRKQIARSEPIAERHDDAFERSSLATAAGYIEPRPAAAMARGHEPQPAMPQAPIPQAPIQDNATARRPAIDQRPPMRPAQRPAQMAAPQAPPAPAPAPQVSDHTSSLQQSIARIHDASQAPPLSPPEYRVLFDAMSQEISDNGLLGVQTLANVLNRARERGVELRRDDVRFVLEVVSEQDPWFENGSSSSLFASRFRNYVAARCRDQGLNLTADEIDLIDAWFTGAGAPAASAPAAQPAMQPPPQRQAAGPGERWWSNDEARQRGSAVRGPTPQQGNDYPDGDYGATEEFPRIVKNRLRS